MMTDEKIMKITAETTPNPNTLKFVLHRTLLDKGSVEYSNADDAKNVPLAAELLKNERVKSVFIGHDFVTLAKGDTDSWADLAEFCADTIRKVFGSSENAIGNASDDVRDASADDNNSSEIVQKIIKVLDEEIRPAVAADGGDILFHGFKDGVVSLHLQGACSTCPSATMTLKMGVESRLKALFPEITEVVQT